MAWDEALLAAVNTIGQPVLRLYAWTEPAATFGYFQKFADVARMTPLRPLIRRPTGGGLVPHDCDWTYSLTVPPGHDWYELRATASYRRIHEWIQSAFAALETPVALSPGQPREVPGQCFVGAEQFDLTWGGRKIAGAAQRRNRHGLLIQGSIQPPPAIERQRFISALLKQGTQRWKMDWTPLQVSPAMQSGVLALVAQKYSQAAYNQRR